MISFEPQRKMIANQTSSQGLRGRVEDSVVRQPMKQASLITRCREKGRISTAIHFPVQAALRYLFCEPLRSNLFVH